MNKIILDNLSTEELSDLVKQIEEVKRRKSFWRQRIKGLEQYYNIWPTWYVGGITDNNRDWDKKSFDIWNYFLTKEEAEKARDTQLAITKINDRIDQLNEIWKPNWTQGNWKHFITFSYDWGHFRVYETSRADFWLKLKYLRSREIGDQIIEEFLEDLKLIFNIEV